MSAIGESNYWRDPRVRVVASRHHGWEIDEGRQVAIVELPETECAACDERYDADEGPIPCERHEGHDWRAGDPGETMEIPFRWAVCGVCDGRGKHVNPSIDCGGLTREDFDDDPDFAEAYHGGRYDVTCGECRGRRVVPELDPHTEDERAAVRALDAQARDDADYERACRMERAMGA